MDKKFVIGKGLIEPLIAADRAAVGMAGSAVVRTAVGTTGSIAFFGAVRIAFFAAIGALFFLSQPAWAQEDIFNYPLKPETMNAFTATCARLARHSFVTGNFEQEKKLSRLDRSLKSSGNFIIAANMGMVWDTTAPFPSTLTLGMDYIIQSRAGGQRSVISAQGNETFMRMAKIISAIFSGNAQELLGNFKVCYKGSPSSWEMGLSPLDNAIHSFAERIIMKGDTAIRYIQIYEQNSDILNYILSNHKYPAELTANEKAFFTIPAN